VAARENHLHRHQSIEPDVAGFVDDAHAAAANFFENFEPWNCR
jgi:hypothetical protein